MKKLLYYLGWSLLNGFSKSMLSKALLVCSLTPVLVQLVIILDVLDCDSILFRIKMAIIGAVIFLVSYLGIKIFIPHQIKEHSSRKSFSQYAKDNITSPTDYFKELSNLLRDYGKYCPNLDKQRLQSILPPSEAIRRLGRERALPELSEAYYQLLDCSKPISRNALALMLLLGFLSMFFSILRNIYIILLR